MTSQQRRTALTAAVLTVIDGMSTSDLIGAVTPERIGQELGYSASSVRYQFGLLFSGDGDGGSNPTWTFDRDRLWEVILADVEERVIETTRAARDLYLAALDRVAADRDPAPLFEAVQADLDAYAPGASAAPTALSERAYLLAVAAADASPAISRHLAALRDLDLWSAIHERGLALTGRRPVAGESARSIARAVAHPAEGSSLEGRYARATPPRDRTTARAMLAIFFGLTERDPAVASAPLRGLRCSGRPASEPGPRAEGGGRLAR